MKHAVHVYAVVRVKFIGVEAESQEEAIAKVEADPKAMEFVQKITKWEPHSPQELHDGICADHAELVNLACNRRPWASSGARG